MLIWLLSKPTEFKDRYSGSPTAHMFTLDVIFSLYSQPLPIETRVTSVEYVCKCVYPHAETLVQTGRACVLVQRKYIKRHGAAADTHCLSIVDLDGSTRRGCQSCSWSAEQGIVFFLVPVSWSHETGSAVPSHISLLNLDTQAESGVFSRASLSRFPRRRPSVPSTATGSVPSFISSHNAVATAFSAETPPGQCQTSSRELE